MNMWNDISNFKKWKYTVLRHLYYSPLTFENLASRMSFAKKDVVSTVGSLLAQSLIKKEKATIEIEPEEGSEMRTMIKKRVTQYKITDKGINKLAYWEFRFGLWEKIGMPWDISFDDRYFDDVNKRGKRHNYFGIPPVSK